MVTDKVVSIITDGKTIELNAGQIAALEQGKAFLKSDRLFFTLSGPAGSGKTTLSKEILSGAGRKICTAPTHKAKKVISRSTGYTAKTIHAILGLKPNVELEGFTQSNVLFDSSGNNTMADFDIVLIDEASMLSSDLVKLIKDKATENNIKVFFLGDVRQLPPVGESVGLVFSDPEIEQCRLEKSERQTHGNPLIELYGKILTHIDEVDKIQADIDAHREGLKHGKELMTDKEIRRAEYILNDIPYSHENALEPAGDELGMCGYEFFVHSQYFGKKMDGYFKLGEDLDNRIIAWRNDTVGKWNNYIRHILIGDHHAPLQPGEFLMAYKTITDEDDWRHVIYENSADYVVISVEEGYMAASTYDESIKADIKGWHVEIQEEKRGVEKIFIVSKESYADFYRIEKNFGDFAKTAKNNKKWAWKLYYGFRNRFALLGDIMDGRKLLVAKDFDFGYALTVHKSQGSTYDNVFVIGQDIMSHPGARERNRLNYVALSRPRKAAYILI